MNAIRNEREYEKALERVEMLMDAAPGTSEFDELDELSALVEAYEEKHYPIEPPSVAAALKFRMDQEHLKQADVVRITGIPANRVSEILAGVRPPSKDQIRVLHSKLGIPLQHLMGSADDEFHFSDVSPHRGCVLHFSWPLRPDEFVYLAAESQTPYRDEDPSTAVSAEASTCLATAS
jgi:HTH-type transcriptional regulator/antitoxin HigA